MTRDQFVQYVLPVLVVLAFFGLKSWFSRPEVGADRVQTMLREGATLVDVRSPGEYASGHLPNAVNIPVNEIGARLREIPAGKPVVLYCRSGARSSAAAQTLRSAGRTDVFNAGAMSNLQ
jgi:phage shock protein E